MNYPRIINDRRGIHLKDLTLRDAPIFIYNRYSEWYGSNRIKGVIELYDKVIINFGGEFDQFHIDEEFRREFNLTLDEIVALQQQL